MGTKSKIANFLDSILLKRKVFCIISENCWGNQLYIVLKREYNTPFIGLYLENDDFLRMVNNFDEFINTELNLSHFIDANDFPIAIIYGCTINFLHYKNNEEAVEKWNRRRLRLLGFISKYGYDKLIFKSSSNNIQFVKDFDSISFKRKICFFEDNFKGNKKLFRGGEMVNGLMFFSYRIYYYQVYLKLFN